MKQILPMPSVEDHERYLEMLRSWATYTGLEVTDPFIQVTGHIFGLCVQVNEHQTSTQQQLTRLDARLDRIEQFIITLDDRLTNLEVGAATTNPGENQLGSPTILEMLGEISRKLDAHRQGGTGKNADASYDLHQGHIFLMLRGIRILVARSEISSTTNLITPGNLDQNAAIEAGNLTSAIANTSYKFRPFSKTKKIANWAKSTFHDVDGRWLIKWVLLAFALPATGFSIGFGQHYAQSNHWFDSQGKTTIQQQR